MRTSSPRLADRIRPYLTSTAVLSGLALVGLWGHATHWKFAVLGGDHSHATHVDAPEPPSTQPAEEMPEKLSLANQQSVTKAEINVEKTRNQSIERVVFTNGMVDFNQTKIAQLSVKVPGSIWRVEKQIGAVVKKGEILAIIDAMEVGKAKASFLSAIAELQVREHVLKRLESIEAVVPERQIREAEVAFRKAQIDLFNSREALVNLGLPIRIEDVIGLPTEQLVQRIRFLGLPDDIVSGLDSDRVSANLIPLVAPFSGVVSGREAVVGELVSPAQSVFTIVDLSQMWVQLDVRLEDAHLVRIGQEVKFTPDGQDEVVTGQINWIDSQVDPKTRTLKIRVDVVNPLTENGSGLAETRLLRAHSFGAGEISVERDDNAVVISKRCIQWHQDQPTVFVQRGETEFERRPITVGIENGEFVQVLTGVDPGDSVVDIGSRLLHSEGYNREMKSEP